MNLEKFSHFRHEAVRQLKDLNEKCEREFHISSWPRWDYDLDRGILTFSQDGQPKVVASIQVVGSTSLSSGTWLWSWANQSFPPCVTKEVEKVRAFGELEDLPELAQATKPADEYLGWEMTAIAAKVLGAKGAYRCPWEKGCVYVIYSSVTFASTGSAPESKQLDCATHGAGFQTFVCEHLAANPAQEWFSGEATVDNKWPDAWCADCDVFFQHQGEWNENNESNMKIKILCHHCYEMFRSQQRPASAGRGWLLF
jgi:hypothetical protein